MGKCGRCSSCSDCMTTNRNCCGSLRVAIWGVNPGKLGAEEKAGRKFVFAYTNVVSANGLDVDGWTSGVRLLAARRTKGGTSGVRPRRGLLDRRSGNEVDVTGFLPAL